MSSSSPEAGKLAQPLTGFRIGVTSDRRSEELISAFERRGAEVWHAPALRVAPLTETVALERETRQVIEDPPDFVLITTGHGLQRWIEAADAAGLGAALRETLAASTILVRGAKARGAVRAAGLEEAGSAEDERVATLVDLLLEREPAGRTVTFQLHGVTHNPQIERMEQAGVRVQTVMPYQWVQPEEDSSLVHLIDGAIDRRVDLLTFTAAPAVEAVFAVAHQRGRLDALLEALRSDVLTAVVGEVTAAPLHEVGVDPLTPSRWRMGAMIRLVCDHLEHHRAPRARGGTA